VLGRGGPTFTLLRPPLERTLSHIAHVRRDALHPLHAYVRDRGHDVAGFVRDPLLRPYITNFQARHLVQPGGTAAPEAAGLVGDHPARDQVAYELAAAGPDRELLAAARSALDAMVVVGTTDDVDGALQRLWHTLGWGSPPRCARRNAAPAPIDLAALDAGLREEIVGLNAVDRALYERARAHRPAPAPESWSWHPWRTTADDAGWEPAEFDERRGWFRRVGAGGEARAVLDGPAPRTITVRGPAGRVVTGFSVPAA
jgi:hypothetical protein